MLILAKSFVYEYNELGNLVSAKAYNYTTENVSGTPETTTFIYTDDRLTKHGSRTIAYNAMGCPTSYDYLSASWSRGKLSQLSCGDATTGIETYSFGYNALGQRVSKSFSFTEGENYLYGGRLISSDKQFYYDHSGRLIAEKNCNRVLRHLQ